ncbi:MAG TPA: cupin domain-containing protein [Bordetella sp.]|nr:cupin domain-containing protein [Bordetella sp.]
MSVHKVDWESIAWTQVRAGIERKSFSGSGATLALHRIQPGHELSPHAHPHEQLVYILAGTADFHVGEDIVRLGPGGLLAIPPNMTHYIEVVGSEVVLNLDVFTPARPEYV